MFQPWPISKLALKILSYFMGINIKVPLLNQFFRFAAVGISSTSSQYLVLWIGVSGFQKSAVLVSAIGYSLGAIVGYVLNYSFTFRSRKAHVDAAPRYFVVVGIGLCLNTGLMALFVHQWTFNYWIAQVFTTSIGLFWNFSGSRLWAFKPALG